MSYTRFTMNRERENSQLYSLDKIEIWPSLHYAKQKKKENGVGSEQLKDYFLKP